MGNLMSATADTTIIEELIEFAILSDPHNQCNATSNLDKKSAIYAVIELMSSQGYRPVTIDEFIEERNRIDQNKGVGYNLTVSS